MRNKTQKLADKDRYFFIGGVSNGEIRAVPSHYNSTQTRKLPLPPNDRDHGRLRTIVDERNVYYKRWFCDEHVEPTIVAFVEKNVSDDEASQELERILAE